MLLPPAYVVRREVMFPQVCVCSTFGGGTPSNWVGGGYPILIDWGGTPSQVWIGGIPSQVWMGGTPLAMTEWGTTPPLGQDWMGYPLWVELDGVPPPTPVPGLDGVPYPNKTEQHSQQLLRSGCYAYCVHAGGLSCLSSYFHLFTLYELKCLQKGYFAKKICLFRPSCLLFYKSVDRIVIFNRCYSCRCTTVAMYSMQTTLLQNVMCYS